MLDWINSFTVLIQTISAVNFIYIVTSYIDSVFKLIFNEEKWVKKHFSDNTNQITADLQSLSAIDADTMTFKDGRSIQNELNNLKSEYKALKTEWDNELDDIKAFIPTVRGVKGTKCIFLVISLYCFITLFNIAMLNNFYGDFWFIFTVANNILTFSLSAYLTVIIWGNKWKDKDDVECYIKSIRLFLIAVLVSFSLAGANSLFALRFEVTPIPKVLVSILMALCVFLPFYPCIMNALFAFYKEIIIQLRARKETNTLLKQQSKLHERKLKFDDINKYFTFPPLFEE